MLNAPATGPIQIPPWEEKKESADGSSAGDYPQWKEPARLPNGDRTVVLAEGFSSAHLATRKSACGFVSDKCTDEQGGDCKKPEVPWSPQCRVVHDHPPFVIPAIYAITVPTWEQTSLPVYSS